MICRSILLDVGSAFSQDDPVGGSHLQWEELASVEIGRSVDVKLVKEAWP